MHTESKKLFYIGIVVILGCFILILTILLIKCKHHSGTEKFTQLSEEGDSTYYTVSKSPSGNDCKADTLTQKCNNPGYGICSPSSGCTPNGKTCFENKESCELVTNCDKDSGWEKNADGTDCNIFQCTLNGKPFDTSNPDNNADKLYEYTYHRPNQDDSFPNDTPFCWRKGISDPNINKYCGGGFLGIGCYSEGLPTDINTRDDNWGDYDCFADNLACTSSMTDYADLLVGCPDSDPRDCPTYMYPNSEADGSLQRVNCWRDYSHVNGRIIHYYEPTDYPIIGDKNNGHCI